MIYSTCTLTRDENEAMMEWFQENFPFVEAGMIRFLPGIHPADGFFICRLRRQVEEAP
jgi:16S rRNA (cytosine967-C5)-methyltransferase